MASSEERLRELLAKEVLSDEDKRDIQRIFELSTYDCVQCMINDYSPSSRPIQQHTH